MSKRDKLLILISFLFISNPLFGAETYLSKSYKLYKNGNYQKTLATLSKVRGTKKVLSSKYYLKAITLNKLNRFDDAILPFRKSLRYGKVPKDFYYEYGQALYATNNLEEARVKFRISFKKNFKKITSLYYMAYISQLLEQNKKARNYYKTLLSMEKKDKKIRQISLFQLAEVYLSLSKSKKRMVKKRILPYLRRAKKMIPKSHVASEIEKRIKELEKKYNLDPNLLRNGKALSQKRWSLGFSQGISYDNNITLATDLPSVQATQSDSYIFDTEFNTSYLFNINGLYTSKPRLRILNTRHSDRTNADVYKNDTVLMTAGLNNTYEHKLFNLPASLLLNYEHTYTGRDRLSQKTKIYYARANTYTLGEKFRLFESGPTSIKVKYKSYRAYDFALNNNTVSFIVDQVKALPNGKLLIFFFSADYISLFNNQQSSTNSYLLRVDYIVPQYFPGYSLNLALSTTFLDTKEQKATRGTEKTFTPLIKLSKNLNKQFSYSISYEYTKNLSEDATAYEYSKHVTSFDLNYNF